MTGVWGRNKAADLSPAGRPPSVEEADGEAAANRRHRIVIVGGGFGGLSAAKALRHEPVDVTLIDRHNYHLFQPLLYQVATGGLSPGDVASPLRWILRRQANTQVLLGEVIDLDVNSREVILMDRRIRYDTLILAAGAGNSYFGHAAWRALAPGLKDLEDAGEVRNRIFCAFEAAEKEVDENARREWLSFVVVGAGPTGVELAGALAEIARDTLRGHFRTIEPGEASIQLVDLAPAVLPAFPRDLSGKAEAALVELGVRSRLGVAVKAIDERGVVVRSSLGDVRIPARTVLWAAGIEASPLGRLLEQRAGAELARGGRVVVAPDCSLPGRREIFVIGDMAACRDAGGNQLPGLAPVAMQQGHHVGRLIAGRLRGEAGGPFRYVDKGTLATIGRNRAVAVLGKLRLSGFAAWITWLFVHLLYLVGFQNRVLVLIQWGFHYVTYNRKARLIVAAGSTAAAKQRLQECCGAVDQAADSGPARARSTTSG
ncbi:MAG: NAD(P)/FAD-dependent oxidoreductase [Bryobacterales bacterium]|nr:NAD(P)/FAD-dependent oxidoreductase [Bryobacterales bacterium]